MHPLAFHYLSPDADEALENRRAAGSSGGSHALLPPSEIKVLNLHPGTLTVNHKQKSKVAETEVNIVL